MSYLTKWQITMEELDELIEENPSLRSFMSGYTAELKCRNMWLSDSRVSNVIKNNDHDRKKKGDLGFDYKGHRFNIEVKSLQTASIKEKNGLKMGKVQCDASDRRVVVCHDGSQVTTTNLRVGEFDLLAVNMFSFDNQWQFAFAKNTDLPRTKSKKIPQEQRDHFLSTVISITETPGEPFRMEPWSLLDELVAERNLNDTTG